jgi:predicted phage terminase large subunit-like protein
MHRPAPHSPASVALKAELAGAEAREDFFVFRQHVRPTMLQSWWTKEVAAALQQFYDDLVGGRRPKLAIGAPPQHGKSWAVTDFIAWVAGKNPQLKTIYASYSAELGERANLELQRTIASPRYRTVFPKMRIGASGWACNSELIEYAGCAGSFRNTTIEGAINGLELNLGVIDDPMKGRAEASSKLIRERVWNWFTDDWGSRFSRDAGMIIIMTRWHVDDLLGRFIERGGVTVLAYPAIAERDERYRRRSEALFPELKPLSFLLERKKELTEASWQSLYQQHPITVGGGIFPVEKLTTLSVFDRSNILKSCRYWDKGGTEGGGAYTCGVLMHMTKDKSFIIEHVVRGQWSALEREEKIKYWAGQDRGKLRPGSYEVGVEQEPGSGGKESAEATLRNLAGFKCFADRVTGSKEVRAEPFAAQVQAGNVRLVAGTWHYELLDEMESFPNGRYRDQCDACSGAFNRLVSGPRYNLFSGAFD